MKKIKITLISLLLIVSSAVVGYFSTDYSETQKQRWVFFDLGNTIVNTHTSGHYHYYAGSYEYLKALKAMGINVAIISNIPESFGETYEQKVESLKKYLASHWDDSREFDWSIFDKIYIPMNNSELKPAPYIFLKALEETGGHPSLYISESLKEVEAARRLGMAGFHFLEGMKKAKSNIYIKLEEIIQYIDENSHI